MNIKKLINYFLIASLVSLLLGVGFGTIAAFQFLYPDVVHIIPFYKMRPLHVSSVVGWIFLASTGCIYYFMNETFVLNKFSVKLTKLHFYFFTLGGILLLFTFLMGKFGGREYWEGHPAFSILVVVTWLFFLVNFFRAVIQVKQKWPVYLWMWTTGVVFFLITFIEANLWQIPYFGNNVVRDLTVQWKAYGALVGSWNMLVYGIAMYLVEKITDTKETATSKLAFYMYFLGFFNLLFGWAHHIYVVPCSPYIRIISYIVSMTELIILFKIIYNAGKSIQSAAPHIKQISYQFLASSDVWIFLNLALALLISIPAINLYTHGTHVTVAHAMGSTIGINTFVLLGGISYIILKQNQTALQKKAVLIKRGIWILNGSLFVFWTALIIAGIKKGLLVINEHASHVQVMSAIENYLLVFAIAGIGVCTGIIFIAYTLIKTSVALVKEG